MDKVIERGERIEILVKKSETLADQSLDLRDTSRKVKNKMWWKNKKVMIGIIAIIIIIIVVVVIVVVAWLILTYNLQHIKYHPLSYFSIEKLGILFRV